MRVRRLWVIDPSIHHREDQGIAEVLRGWEGESRVFRPALEPGSGPFATTGLETDGVVLLGSSASVHDKFDWLSELSQWIAPLLDGRCRTPLLGICFGHQLVAHIAGGTVGYLREDHGKCVGVETTQLDGGRLLAGSHELRVVVSHREEVKVAPRGYRRTASRPNVPLDGIEHEELPVFTFQFHPEARDDFARVAGIAAPEIDERLRSDSTRLLAAFRERVRLAR